MLKNVFEIVSVVHVLYSFLTLQGKTLMYNFPRNIFFIKKIAEQATSIISYHWV